MISGHIFKRSLDESTDGFTEIFAYTPEASDGLNVRMQPKELCLKVICDGISNRDLAYASLFDYAEEKEYNLSEIYEKYVINNGKMYIEILASIV
jgi:hypothetical protein